MEKWSSLKWRTASMMFLILMLGTALLMSMNMASPVYAQTAGPTATPTDPVWKAFVAVREAIEEDRSVDLSIVQSYSFEQVEWTYGIDYECDTDVAEADIRSSYFGWEFLITDLFGRTYQARASFDLKAVSVCDQVTQTAAAAPAPTGSNPDLPAPVAGSGATGSFELGGHALGLGNDSVTAMRSAGMTWVKYQMRFNMGDSPSNAQGMINDAKGKGFKILLGIVGTPAQMTNFESYISSYASFVGGVAALGPDAIEVWNEPNLDREWPNGQIDGARYTQLLAAAYNAIKTANPNVMVISGAPAPTGAEAAFPGAVVNDDRFMQQMANAGAASYLDCVGLHYNEGIVSPGTSSGDPRGEFPSYYFGSMLARGYTPFGGKPVCWTELGYLSPEGMGSPLPSLFGWAKDVTVAQHAAWLADAAARSAQSGRVRLMIIWNVNFQRWDSDPMGGYAIIRPDGKCPACAALGSVMKK